MTKSQINQYMRENYSESNRPAQFGDKTYRVWTGLRWKTGKDNPNLTTLTTLTSKTKNYIYKGGSFNTPVNRLNPLNEQKYRVKEDIPSFVDLQGNETPFYASSSVISLNSDIAKILLEDNKIEKLK